MKTKDDFLLIYEKKGSFVNAYNKKVYDNMIKYKTAQEIFKDLEKYKEFPLADETTIKEASDYYNKIKQKYLGDKK